MEQSESRYTAIGYTLPAHPSRLRVSVWRKLRQMGAENVQPGLAVLPQSAAGVHLLSQLCEAVRAGGGAASLYTLVFSDPGEEAALAKKLAENTRAALGKLRDRLRRAEAEPGVWDNRKLFRQVRATLDHTQKVGAPPDSSVRREVEDALRQMREAIGRLPAFVSEELRGLLG